MVIASSDDGASPSSKRPDLTKLHSALCQIHPDGWKYKGEWKGGLFHGRGTYTWSNGEKYVGEWKDGKKYGQGTYIYHHGFKYVGEWKDNKKHGQGTYTLTDGNRFEGEWKDGNQWNLTILDKNGNIIGKWVNGVLQK